MMGYDLDDLRSNLKCYAICLALAAGPMEFGIDNSILNGLQATPAFIKLFGQRTKVGTFILDTSFQQLITSLPYVGLIVGSLFIGPLSHFCGRRTSMAVASIICYIGITVQVTVTTRPPLYLGRFMLGIANGLYVGYFPLYASEVASPRFRAVNVSLIQITLSFGTLIGSVISNAFHAKVGRIAYQKQLSILYALPTWILLIVYFLPESPRWLVMRGIYFTTNLCIALHPALIGQLEKAKRHMARSRGSSYSEVKLDIEMAEIVTAIEAERNLAARTQYVEMWRGVDLRRTLLCAASDTFQAASGLMFFLAYGTLFFQIAGVSKPFTGQVIINTTAVACALTTGFTMKRIGRRPLLIFAFAMETIGLYIIAILYTAAPHRKEIGKALVAIVSIYFGVWNGIGGPTAFVAASEIPSNRLRSATFGFGRGVGLFFAWLTVFTTPYFINPTALNWGAKVAWIWATSCLITLVFIYFLLPETRGRSLEEIDELFYLKVPAGKFQNFDLTEVDRKFGISIANQIKKVEEKTMEV